MNDPGKSDLKNLCSFGTRPEDLRELCAQAAAETLDMGLVVCDVSYSRVLYANPHARGLLDLFARASTVDNGLPQTVQRAMKLFAESRESTGRAPPAVRLVSPASVVVYFRALPIQDSPHRELLVVRREVNRSPDLFRVLESRFGITRREFHVVCGLRRGQTNREIAAELGISTARVAALVSQVMRRLEASNRTSVVNMVERLASKRL